MDATNLRPQPGPQQAFLSSKADIAIYGGAAGGGKTWALLLESLRHMHRPDFGAVIFRRTYPQITAQGGMWDESRKVYPYVGARGTEDDLTWTFPSGAKLKFAHLQHESNVEDWQGSQIPLIGFDELTHFTERQFFYLLSRNRSVSGVRPYVRATCNPDADSWVARLIAWWIDAETGFPIPERAGAVRWFVRDGERFTWADTPDGLIVEYPEIPPKSVSFIPARLQDNQILMAHDPGYLANLMAQPLVERERLLGGNWKIRATPGNMFRREWFAIVDDAPASGRTVRCWDLAATEASKGKDPDWTAGALVTAAEGRYYIRDMRRLRGTPASVEALVKQTAELDGHTVNIWMEQEPGSSGVNTIDHYRRHVLPGFAFYGNRSTGKKEIRANPVSSAAEAGNVLLVRGAWNNEFIEEAERFPDGAHDDQCFVAGTRIKTPTGTIPIESIRVGDIVCSSQGNHSVTASGMTNPHASVMRVVLTDGKELVGTGNHPVFTANRGYVHLDSLTGDDIIVTWQQKSSHFRVSPIGAIQTPRTRRISATTAPVSRTRLGDIRHFIRKYGSPSTGQSLPDVRSTMKMATGTTTPLPIWYALPQQSMAQGMPHSIEHRNNWRISPTSRNGQNPGIVPMKGEHGIGNMLARLGCLGSIPSTLARSAVSPTVRAPVVPPTGFAHSCAPGEPGPHRDGESTSLRSVCTVDTLSWPKRSVCGSAPVRVRYIQGLAEPQSVYNLTVADAHDFYADGILVHNCDAVAGAVEQLYRTRPDLEITRLDGAARFAGGAGGWQAQRVAPRRA